MCYSTGEMLALHTCTYRREAVRGWHTMNTTGERTRRCKGWGKPRIEKETKGTEKRNSTEGRTDECDEAMLRRLYLRLGLLGWRRCGGGGCCCCDCCGASPVAMAAPLPLPVPLSWCCCRAALLLEREAPCERACPWLWLWLWPSDGEGFDVPGLLWDFSIVGTCVSKTTRFTILPKKLFCTLVKLEAVTFVYHLWWLSSWLVRNSI